jgi:hypothetical protein
MHSAVVDTQKPGRRSFAVIAIWLPIQVLISTAIVCLHPPLHGMSPDQMFAVTVHRGLLAAGETMLSILLLCLAIFGKAISNHRLAR